MSKAMTKLHVMVDIKTADKIAHLAKDWDISLSATMRFMLKHYLKFDLRKGKIKREGNLR